MSFVVLDTDVTSNAFKRRDLPPPIVEAILHNQLCITFVTLAELTKWSVNRQWGLAYRRRLDAWLSNVLVLPYNDEIHDVARTWGTIAAHAQRRGRPRPQKRHVGSCLLSILRPTLGHPERQGLQGLRRARRSEDRWGVTAARPIAHKSSSQRVLEPLSALWRGARREPDEESPYERVPVHVEQRGHHLNDGDDAQGRGNLDR